MILPPVHERGHEPSAATTATMLRKANGTEIPAVDEAGIAQ